MANPLLGVLLRNQNWKFRAEILYQIHCRCKLLELPLLPTPTRQDFVDYISSIADDYNPALWDGLN